MKTLSYQRLSDREREEISRGLAASESLSNIARRLGRYRSTVFREVARYGANWRGYRATNATNRARAHASLRRHGKTRLAANHRLRAYVHAKLALRWSPREIVRRMVMEYPQDESMRVSHETIYRHIYVLPRGSLRKELIAALRHEHKYRRKNGRKLKNVETRGKVAGMLSIEERPKEVEGRIIPGHWEGDLIIGLNKKTAIGTLVERTTRYTILVPLRSGKDSVSVRKAYTKALGTVPKELAKTLTYDQGSEMAQHKKFTIDTGIQVYFAHPASPWERGTNENTNGLIRQYFPKGTDFSKVPTWQLKRVQRQLNDRPRAALDFHKPDEAFKKLVALNA